MRALGATEQLKHFYKQLGSEPPPPAGAAPAVASGAEGGEGGEAAAAAGSAAAGKRAAPGGAHDDDDAKRVKTAAPAALARPLTPPRAPLLPPAELDALLTRLGPHLIAQLVIGAMPQLPPKPPPPSAVLPSDPATRAAAVAGERKAAVLAPPARLDASSCSALAETALASLLGEEREAQLEARGHAEGRAALLGRLAARQPAGGAFCRALSAHVLASPKARLPLALAWLHAELAASTPPAEPADDGEAAPAGSAEAGAAPTTAHMPDTASSRYDELALALLPSLRRALPPNDRAYITLLLEAPRLKGAWLPELIDLDSEDRWRLGIAALRELALRRDALAAECLDRLLDAASSTDAELRHHTIRILTAQLLPAPRLAERITAFADAQLGVTLAADGTVPPSATTPGDGAAAPPRDTDADDAGDADDLASRVQVQARDRPGDGSLPRLPSALLLCALLPPLWSQTSPACPSWQLYLAVCAKQPARLWTLLSGFAGAAPPAQAMLVRETPGLVPHVDAATLGALLLRAMRELRPIAPCAPLLLALLEALATAPETPPAPELVESVVLISRDELKVSASARPRRHAAAAAWPRPPCRRPRHPMPRPALPLRRQPPDPYHRAHDATQHGPHPPLSPPRRARQDARFALPLLAFLTRPHVEALLPLLLAAPPETAKAALVSLMHAPSPPLPPAHLMLYLHELPSDGSRGVSLKQAIEAVQTCIAEKSIFTMQVMADALQLIVHLDPLPLIFMRTTIQALLYHPLLAEFTMGLLRHLISRQIWTFPRLWTGFIKCCQQGLPHSLPVLLSLPAAQLAEVMEQQPDLRPQLLSYGASHLGELKDDVKEALDLVEEEEDLEL